MKYAIISINDRAKDNIEKNKNLLSRYEELNIASVDGSKQPVAKMLEKMSITLDNWKWVSPLKGELGVWMSNVLFFQKMIDENIDQCLLIEDDAILSDDFVDNLEKILLELPKSFDLLTLLFPKNSLRLYKKDADIGLNNICLAKYNHFGNLCILWSKKGAEKILSLIKEEGILYPIDMHLFHYAANKNLLEAYSVKPDHKQIVSHSNVYKSTIDINGKRGTLEV